MAWSYVNAFDTLNLPCHLLSNVTYDHLHFRNIWLPSITDKKVLLLSFEEISDPTVLWHLRRGVCRQLADLEFIFVCLDFNKPQRLFCLDGIRPTVLHLCR